MDSTSIIYSNTSSKSNSTNACDASTNSFAAKLRRLRIEESILLQNINKNASLCSLTNEDTDSKNFIKFTDFKKFVTETKKSFNELKQLYQDITASTSSKEVIKALDIDDIKKNTLELENNMKKFKAYLHTELNALKAAERQLNQKLNDPALMNYLKRKPRVQTAKYNDVVPSPVKTLMTSPLKCSEVHDFQEFLKNSKNRYGGWDEYHHNIFVNLWRKHFDIECFKEDDDTRENSIEFKLFLQELLPKLPGGIGENEVKLHCKWYEKYLCLKDRQQKAIDKWRSNRRKIKRSNAQIVQNNVENNCSIKNKHKNKNEVNRNTVHNMDNLSTKEDWMLDKEEIQSFTRKCLSDEIRDEYNKVNSDFEEHAASNEPTVAHFLKSTKQWTLRCSSQSNKNEKTFNNVETLQKLGSPLWRAGLKDIA